jgi:hypothetical protein
VCVPITHAAAPRRVAAFNLLGRTTMAIAVTDNNPTNVTVVSDTNTTNPVSDNNDPLPTAAPSPTRSSAT